MVFVIGLEAPGPASLRRTRRWARSRARTTYPRGLGVCIGDRGRAAEASAPRAAEAETGARPTGPAPTPPFPEPPEAPIQLVVPAPLGTDVSRAVGFPGRCP